MQRSALQCAGARPPAATCGWLEHELERLAADHDPRALVLDLSRLDFMDSTGLRLIVLAGQRAEEEGRTFALVRGPEDVHRVFEITRMTDRLRFLDSAAEAGSLGGAPT
jgi:anti-anti-sigma factor